MTNQSLLLEKTTSVLLGTYDFRDLAKKAVALIVDELTDQNLIGAAIMRIDHQKGILQAYAYATKYRRTIDKLLPKSFSELSLPLTTTDNLSVKTVVTNQIQQSARLADYSYGVLSPELADRVQKIMKGKMIVSFPIRIRTGRVAGLIMFLLREKNIQPQQLVLFETFANQLGLAFSNVFEFEKLLHRYKTDLNKPTNVEDAPNLKFTLRITAKENKRLAELAKEKNKTKAEIMRELIDKI